MKVINIHQEQGAKKDAVRVSEIKDIPDFLSEAIKIVDGRIQLECVEGNQSTEPGVVIGYEKSEKTSSGYNCWVIGNAAKSLVEIDGVFYKKALIYQAAPMESDELPEFMDGLDVHKNDDGSWTIKKSWGDQTGFPGEAYWIYHGVKEDGTKGVSILTKLEESFRSYFVCDEVGNNICKLSEYVAD